MRIAVSLALALAVTGCVSTTPPTTTSVDIPLQQVGPDGAVYHLTGTFSILAGNGSTISVDASGTSPTVSANVPPGIAQVTLDPGWTLGQSTDGGTTFTPVDAIVSSANPVVLRVLPNHADTIEFDFIVRKPNGSVTIQFGVDPNPRELAGGIIIQSGTLDYTQYINKRFDFGIYFDSAPVKLTLADGTKQLVFDSQNNNAMEAFNDTIGVFQNTVAPAMAGGVLHYTVSAKPDGTTEVAGSYQGFGSPSSTINFGPHTQLPALPLDADGFPVDEFFYDSELPFTGDTFFDDGDATFGGILRMRFIPAN